MQCTKCGQSDVQFGKVHVKGKVYDRKVCKRCMNKRERELYAADDFEITEEPPDAAPTAPHPVPWAHEDDAAKYAAFRVDPLCPDGRAYAFSQSPVDNVKRVLFIPDVHRPYHDKAAWALMLKAARDFKPDKIVVLGDFADFYSVSSFDKHPKRVTDLKSEAEDANVGLDELDALDATTKMFIKGNHEDRLERYLCKSAPALFGCVSVNDLFRLNERGWQVTEYKDSTRLGKLRLTHDTGTAGINAHRQSVDAFQASCAIGHTHRMEMSFRGNADGNPTVGAMFGWLGDFDAVDYLQKVRAKRDWTHGFGVGFQEESTGIVHISPVPIVKGSCCVAGRIYR